MVNPLIEVFRGRIYIAPKECAQHAFFEMAQWIKLNNVQESVIITKPYYERNFKQYFESSDITNRVRPGSYVIDIIFTDIDKLTDEEMRLRLRELFLVANYNTNSLYCGITQAPCERKYPNITNVTAQFIFTDNELPDASEYML